MADPVAVSHDPLGLDDTASWVEGLHLARPIWPGVAGNYMRSPRSPGSAAASRPCSFGGPTNYVGR